MMIRISVPKPMTIGRPTIFLRLLQLPTISGSCRDGFPALDFGTAAARGRRLIRDPRKRAAIIRPRQLVRAFWASLMSSLDGEKSFTGVAATSASSTRAQWAQLLPHHGLARTGSAGTAT